MYRRDVACAVETITVLSRNNQDNDYDMPASKTNNIKIKLGLFHTNMSWKMPPSSLFQLAHNTYYTANHAYCKLDVAIKIRDLDFHKSTICQKSNKNFLLGYN